MADDPFDERFSREMSDTGVELRRIGDLADGVGRSLSRALRGAVVDGRSLNSVLGEIARSFSDIALKAAFKPLGMLAENAVNALFKAADPALMPFAKGGVVAAPTYFPMQGGMGLMGEAGPEAILPLKRGPDGSLGVAAGGGRAVNVTFNVKANDARSFVASEAEVSAMLLRAVKRGARGS